MVVTAASVQDRDGAKQLLAILRHKFSRLRHIWADGAYAGPLVDWVQGPAAATADPPGDYEAPRRLKGFVVIPKRWIVERTLGWFNRYRRLSKDYEYYRKPVRP